MAVCILFVWQANHAVVAAMKAHGIKFARATASSGGVMAALAILDAANLELGTRQCFDLRSEPATIPASMRSFFAVYRQYFRCFRSAADRKRVPISELGGRLFLALSRSFSGVGVSTNGLSCDLCAGVAKGRDF